MIKSDGEGDEFEFAFAAREDWTASIISSIGGNESMRAFPSRFGSQSFPVGFAASRSVPPSVQLEPRGGGGGRRARGASAYSRILRHVTCISCVLALFRRFRPAYQQTPLAQVVHIIGDNEQSA